MAEDRIAALRQRMKHTEGETIAETPARKATGVSDRKRHTVYLSKTLMKAIDRRSKMRAPNLTRRISKKRITWRRV